MVARFGLMLCLACVAVVPAVLAAAGSGDTIDGKAEFEEHCAECHANGGNIVNPAKTLRKKDRLANGVVTADDIIAKMRHPGPGMTPFDKAIISDRAARAIADYIIEKF